MTVQLHELATVEVLPCTSSLCPACSPHLHPCLPPQYHYHTLGARGSGEFALRHLLEPFAWPRAPLEERMAELDVPITFIYGGPAGREVLVSSAACLCGISHSAIASPTE